MSPYTTRYASYSDRTFIDTTASDNFAAGGWIHTHYELKPPKSEKPKVKKLKCWICSTIIRNKSYIITSKWGDKRKVCSNCKYIFDIIYSEIMTNNNEDAITSMYRFIFIDFRYRTFIITKNHKTRKNGKFIKPSSIVKSFGYFPSHLEKMKNKCCRFCEKQFIKTYTLVYDNLNGGKIRICRNCEFLFKLMLEERRRNRERHLKALIGIPKYVKIYHKEDSHAPHF